MTDMLKFDRPLDGDVVIVESDDVAGRSRDGFQLAGVVHNEVEKQESVLVQERGYSEQKWQRRYVPLKQFIMWRPPGATKEALRDELEALRDRLGEVERERSERDSLLAKSEAALKAVTEDRDQLTQRFSQLETLRVQQRSALLKMEEHIGKLREAIGTERFDEILGYRRP